jgi:acyl-CoA synthetase (AMP-forming)/AMP-acid ligase II/thioesterase domain-containing protein/acyl carrier protein
VASIGAIIREHALARPDHPAIVSDGRTPLGYAALQRQIDAIGRQLRAGGLSPVARIAVVLPDGPEAAVAVLAIACHAAVAPIGSGASVEDVHHLVDHARLDAVLLMPAAPARLRSAFESRGTMIIAGTTHGDATIGLSLRVASDAKPATGEPKADDIALVLRTSGTTGRRKLVPVTHANLIAEAEKFVDWFKLGPDDRCLNMLPLQYAHGLRETLFPPILTGGGIARPQDPMRLDIARWFGALAPTWYSTFPIFHQAILDLIAAEGVPPRHALRFALSAGTPLKPALQAGLEQALGVPVLEFYGIGEAGHMTANLPQLRRDGTCGRARTGEMMIALDGKAVEPGRTGEICLRGASVIAGYLGDPELNREVFVDGWFRTGDLGRVDADGFMSIEGRVKELINRGGEKLAPGEVERALLRHPAVADAAVCGLPHPRLGEDVAAAVVLRNGAETAPAELQRFVRGVLKPFEVPRFVAIVEALPKDVTGKLQRRELAEMLAQATAASADSDVDDPFCPLAADLMQLWCGLLQCSAIGLDDDFFVKGGDSLLAVQMRLAIEKLTGLELPDSLPFEAPTIRQLTQAITESSRNEPRPVLTEWVASERPPFFFFHGDYVSDGLYVRRLARFVGDAARIVSVAPHNPALDAMPPTIEAMARDRLQLILATQPQGPYRLGGHCNGGAVALEVARLLRQAGHEVKLLALIDVPLLNANPAVQLLRSGLSGGLALAGSDSSVRARRTDACIDYLWTINGHARRFWQMSAAKRRAKLAKRLKLAATAWRRQPGDPAPAPAHPGPDGKLLGLHAKKYFRAVTSYVPMPLDVPMVYYAAEHSGRPVKRLSSRAQVVRIPGDHYTCITTHLHVLAKDLAGRLNG